MCTLYLIIFLFVSCRKADDMFGHLDVWANVPDRDRRDLFDDVIHMLAKREKVTKSYTYNFIKITHI